jgi:hypothetical protein
MIRISNKPLLSLVCLLMSIGMFTACKKNSDVTSDVVQLLSFGPTGALHGDTISFIGRNLNVVTEINFTGASAVVPQSAFLQQTAELIKVVVPKTAEQGFVTLKTPQGQIVTKTKLNLNVASTITSITAQARPGENITISGNYLNWVTRVTFAKNKNVDSFVSKSIDKLVVTVPMDAQTGTLVISYGGTKPMQVETVDTLKVTLPTISSISPIPIEREGNLTITGTNLDLTQGVLFKGMAAPATVFVSKSATQLVIKVPKEANKGKISLVAYSLLTVESSQNLTFVGDLPDLEPLKYAMYIDKLENGWQNWGWGSTIDFASTENVRDGAASISVNYTGEWSALKFANVTVSTAPYSQLAFSIYGTPGTGGKKINVTPSGGSTYTITIEEGKWIEYKLPKTTIGNPATISDLTFQNQAWTGKIFVDQVGLR